VLPTYEADGLVHPGKFVRVELMVKDAQRYKHTDGWGWGRWRGLDLKPYGEDPRFVQQCISCHLPVRGNDYVYTEPMTTSQLPGDGGTSTREFGEGNESRKSGSLVLGHCSG
jgi:Cytochrome P460